MFEMRLKHAQMEHTWRMEALNAQADIEEAKVLHNPSEPGFIPYDQLTEEIVLGWVYAGLGDQKAVIEATLTAKVEAQLNPVTANGVPWNTAPAAA